MTHNWHTVQKELVFFLFSLMTCILPFQLDVADADVSSSTSPFPLLFDGRERFLGSSSLDGNDWTPQSQINPLPSSPHSSTVPHVSPEKDILLFVFGVVTVSSSVFTYFVFAISMKHVESITNRALIKGIRGGPHAFFCWNGWSGFIQSHHLH